MRSKQILDILEVHVTKLDSQLKKDSDGNVDAEWLSALPMTNPFLYGQIYALGALNLDVIFLDMECEEKDQRRTKVR